MPVTYCILPSRNLVVVRFSGHALVSDSYEALAAFARDPDFRPGLNQIIDLTGVTGFDPDYLALIRVQAAKASVFEVTGPETLNVYIAPTDVAGRLVTLILRSWNGIPGIRHSVAGSEDEALDILGLTERSVAELIEQPV